MPKLISFLAAFLAAFTAMGVAAQPTQSPDQKSRSISPYVYMSDPAGDKVLLSTQFWRNDLEYDVRALRRFFAVMAALEQRGFKKNDAATIDWDKKENVVRCFIYLEDLKAGKGKNTGARTWCQDSGLGEFTVSPSDDPKHVSLVLKRFDTHFAGAKRNMQK